MSNEQAKTVSLPSFQRLLSALEAGAAPPQQARDQTHHDNYLNNMLLHSNPILASGEAFVSRPYFQKPEMHAFSHTKSVYNPTIPYQKPDTKSIFAHNNTNMPPKIVYQKPDFQYVTEAPSMVVYHFKCRFCYKKCATVEELEKHEHMTHSKSCNVCPYCSKGFARRHDMLRHTRTVHKQMPSNSDDTFNIQTDPSDLDIQRDRSRTSSFSLSPSSSVSHNSARLVEHCNGFKNQMTLSVPQYSSLHPGIRALINGHGGSTPVDEDFTTSTKTDNIDIIERIPALILTTSHSAMEASDIAQPYDTELAKYIATVQKQYVPNIAFKQIDTSDGTFFQCTKPECGKRFTRRADNAKGHWMGHHQLDLYLCSMCGNGFKRAADVVKHADSVHGQ